ncbi:MAG: dimethyl sulfoxide reductase anchor subunit [Rhodocyclales bacterium]|nr:dimethyl sulfoxide reductase anchor subunit [Rhodocyclales bacterium]
MKPFNPRAVELAAPKQQRNWDWRAAANFICGGSGGGLLLYAAFAGFGRGSALAALLAGMTLIATGLTCVWFEIGRPWRALNVYRHIATSWMTREAVVALAVFGCGALAVLTGSVVATLCAGVCGGAFLYSQARILAANKGIPAWRHPASVPLLVATGLAEGAALALAVGALGGAAIGAGLLVAAMILVIVRAWAWQRYRTGLGSTGAPEAALRVLDGFAPRLLWLGTVLPALAVLALLLGMPGQGPVLLLVALLAAGSGAWLKYTLVRRAAYTQGLAIDHIPVRGRGPSGPAAKPGWKMMPDGNRG